MTVLTAIETYIDKENNYFGSFLIEPLEAGHGITLGNAIRRTLLSDLTSYAITGVRINNIKHEFAVIEGLREDILEVLLNLKEIIFKTSFVFQNGQKIYQKEPLKGFLNLQGPVIVTAGMLKLPKNRLKILNPNQYICTILDTSEFYLEIDIENGKGYQLMDDNRRKKESNTNLIASQPSTLFIDSIFMPIKKVNYKIKLINDTQGHIKESLNLEITTNGSITPKRSLYESIKILLNLFYPLLFDSHFLSLVSKIEKKR